MKSRSPEPIAEIISLWERQQDAYVAHRAQRFNIMLDAISYTHPEVRLVLDIGGGLGSFSKLILQHFPNATVLTLDYDPALLKLPATTCTTTRDVLRLWRQTWSIPHGRNHSAGLSQR